MQSYDGQSWRCRPILFTVFDMTLVPLQLDTFSVGCFINSFCVHAGFGTPFEEGWHILSIISDSQSGRMEQVARDLMTQR